MHFARNKPLLWVTGVIIVGLTLTVFKCQTNKPIAAEVTPNQPTRGKRLRTNKPPPGIDRHLALSKNETVWKDPGTDTNLKVRITIQMSAETTMTEDDRTARGDVAITFAEGAEFRNLNTAAWQVMDDAQFKRWMPNTGHLQRLYSTTASITKNLDKITGEPVIVEQSACGTSKDDPDKDWTMCQMGIAISLDWRDDNLIIRWEAEGVESTEQILKIPFSDRFVSAKQQKE